MSEYIVRVNEDNQRWHYVQKQYEYFFGYPLVDEIVRCRDCVYRGWSDAGGHFCARSIGLTVTPDGFCAWGERKEEK